MKHNTEYVDILISFLNSLSLFEFI